MILCFSMEIAMWIIHVREGLTGHDKTIGPLRILERFCRDLGAQLGIG